MRKMMIILMLVALGVAINGDVLAVPNCGQVSTSLCNPYSDCTTVSIQFNGPCDNNQRQYRCKWEGGTCDPFPVYGPWSTCTCHGTGCDCLLEGTSITMADGSTKPVEMIRKGDRVLAFDQFTSRTMASMVTAVHAPYVVSHYYVINGEIRVTENHPMLSGGKWVAVGTLAVGGWLTAVDGLDEPILSIERIDQKARVYNFQVAAGTYVAQNVIVHNKEDCEEYQQDPAIP